MDSFQNVSNQPSRALAPAKPAAVRGGVKVVRFGSERPEDSFKAGASAGANAAGGAKAAPKAGFFGRVGGFFRGTGDAAMGPIRALATLGKYVWVAENRKILTGFGLQYGVPLATAASFALGPMGWILGGMMIVPSFFLSKMGERMIDRMESYKVEGPLGRITAIKQTWTRALENKAKDLVEIVRANREHVKAVIKDANRLIDDLLPDSERVPNISKVRSKLYMQEEGRVAKFLTHALSVHMKYQTRLTGKILAGLRNTIGKIPVIRYGVLAFTLSIEGFLMLLSHNEVKRAAAAAAKTVAAKAL